MTPPQAWREKQKKAGLVSVSSLAWPWKEKEKEPEKEMEKEMEKGTEQEMEKGTEQAMAPVPVPTRQNDLDSVSKR
eukprot:1005600-Pyramimonas_sp.AAC.1